MAGTPSSESKKISTVSKDLISKIAEMNFVSSGLREKLSEEEIETLLVGAGMAEAYLEGALTVQTLGLETLRRANQLAQKCIDELGGLQ